jgi:hypothetical protein
MSPQNQMIGLYEVQVFNTKTNETAVFAVEPHVTLEEVWNMTYDDLNEVRGQADILEDAAGHPLTEHLSQTIKHIAEHVDKSLEFQIHGEQGGA